MKQADGLLAELNVSFCYDFVEQCCDFVYKSLSLMQRFRYEWSGSTAIIAHSIKFFGLLFNLLVDEDFSSRIATVSIIVVLYACMHKFL